MMFLPHPTNRNATVRYFYLPASKERYAEIIEVLHSTADIIVVPMREEDVELEAIFERPLSDLEADACKKAETWKLFNTWEELKQDHLRFGVPAELVMQLLCFRSRFELHEEMAA